MKRDSNDHPIAAGILHQYGLTHLIEMVGGLAAWEAAQLYRWFCKRISRAAFLAVSSAAESGRYHQTNGTDLRAGFNMMYLTSIVCPELER